MERVVDLAAVHECRVSGANRVGWAWLAFVSYLLFNFIALVFRSTHDAVEVIEAAQAFNNSSVRTSFNIDFGCAPSFSFIPWTNVVWR